MEHNLVTYNIFKKNWMSFDGILEIVQTSEISEVLEKFNYIQEKSFSTKIYAIGFISYDAAEAFDPSLKVLKGKEKSNIPLIWFAMCSRCKEITLPQPSTNQNYFSNWIPSVSKPEYNKALSRIKKDIFVGNTYQVNYTFRQNSDLINDGLFNLFIKLASSQQSHNCTYIETEDFAICSASPELFFTYDKGKLTSRPMKGTAKRGLTFEEDQYIADELKKSEKNIAENVMIVDMIRNDFGKISKLGSVKVEELFKIEKYPTLWQMTSKVSCDTTSTLTDIMKAIFPCASITGAPKASTMKIVSETEKTPRGVYTGGIGFIDPKNNQAQFNVAIRTVVIDKIKQKAEYGIGGGITWYSSTNDEYEESLLKAKILSTTIPSFEILETILWEKTNGYFLLEKHLKRMQLSAKYFEYQFNELEIKKNLNLLEKQFNNEEYKIRITLSKNGTFHISSEQFSNNNKIYKISLAKNINTKTPFFCNKTTNRVHYDTIRKQHPLCDEVVIINEDEEITEGTFSNIVLKIDDKLYTPPISAGLLNGTFREYLIENGEIFEKHLFYQDLKKASEIYIINSVRKYQRCELIT